MPRDHRARLNNEYLQYLSPDSIPYKFMIKHPNIRVDIQRAKDAKYGNFISVMINLVTGIANTQAFSTQYCVQKQEVKDTVTEVLNKQLKELNELSPEYTDKELKENKERERLRELREESRRRSGATIREYSTASRCLNCDHFINRQISMNGSVKGMCDLSKRDTYRYAQFGTIRYGTRIACKKFTPFVNKTPSR